MSVFLFLYGKISLFYYIFRLFLAILFKTGKRSSLSSVYAFFTNDLYFNPFYTTRKKVKYNKNIYKAHFCVEEINL